MNRLIRIILYVTAACTGIGIAAVIISLSLGGGGLEPKDSLLFSRAEDAVRNAARILDQKMHITDRADEEDDILDTEDSRNSHRLSLGKESSYNGSVLTADASALRLLEIELHHGSFTVSESDGDYVRVFVSDDTAEKFTAECENGKLVIRDNRQGSESRKDICLELEIPEGMRFENANIQVNAGVLESECYFQADTLTLNVDAGEIYFSDLSAERFVSTVGAGIIDIEDSVFGSAKLDCGAGTMSIEASISGDSQISCGMGEVEIELEEGVDSVNYDLSCGMGYIEIGDDTYSALSKKKRISNGAAATFQIDCGMGAVIIE